ncbi:MAG TPA: hypothetical protein PKA37_13000, partial [Planctomycetota bacterium]|nr:hypothetical protein [Planctomycetota bacterium]
MFPSSPFVKVFLGLLVLIGSLAAQAPRPRIAFTQADLPALQARIGLPGPIGTAYNSMVSTAAYQSSSNQASFTVQRSLRRMHELAVKYQLTQNVTFGENAKSMLLAARNSLVPTGSTAYVLTTYPSVMGVTFDLIYDLLTPAERASIVSHLEAWVTAMRVGTGGMNGYTSYSAAVDNYSFSWCTGIALTLMAIEGDSNYPNLQGLIQTNLQMIHAGWLDAVSPDGSIDESFGYANYGIIAALNAAIASENCGYGDIITGTNILKTPRWYGSSLNDETLLWHGDSSASHKGTRLDPMIHFVLQRAPDPKGLWALNRIFAIEPPSDYSPCHGWSPHANMFLRYPTTVTPQEPPILSAFFRDNLNEGPAAGNRNAAFSQVGTGGHALLHNSRPSNAWQKLTAYYMIRDEWMSHAHEDDGHFSVGVGGSYQFLDQGYSGPTFERAQSTDHNIVVVAGEAGFLGNTTNYYNPPSTTNGRFMGKVERRFFSEGIDYVRGSHEFMWMMNQAQRSVVMIKDAQAPYTILMDRVSKDSQSRTYQQLFHSAGPASGSGTIQSPMLVTGGGATLRSSWLAPAGATLVPGTAITSGSAVAYKHIVQATGTDLSFVSIHGATSPTSSQPLLNAQANTVGGRLQWNGYS